MHRSKEYLLFDHLVSARKQCRRYGEAECLGGVQVDHQLEYRRLLRRKVGGLPALEYRSTRKKTLTLQVQIICTQILLKCPLA